MQISKKVDDIAGRVHQHTVGMSLKCVVCGCENKIRETDTSKIENPVVFHSQNMIYKPCKECGGNVFDVDTFVSVTLMDSSEAKVGDESETPAKTLDKKESTENVPDTNEEPDKTPDKQEDTDKKETPAAAEPQNGDKKHIGVDVDGLSHVCDMSKAGINIQKA